MSFIARLFGEKPEQPKRLSHAEALNLARVVAGEWADRLVMRGVWADNGRMTWHFWTATKGSGATVRVDDETSQTDVELWSGR